MIDARNRHAEFGQPLALRQLMGERPLHDGERRLGAADLVAPTGRRDHPRGVLRALAKGDDVGREAAHRLKHHAPQRRPQHAGDDGGDGQRNREKIVRHAPQRLNQRRLVEGELDRRFVRLRRSAQLHDRPGRGEQGVEGGRHALEIGSVVSFDRLDALQWPARGNELAASRRRLDRHPLHVDAVQDLLRQVVGRRGRSGHPESVDSRLNGADLAVQQHLAMGREPGHIEQAHREEDEADRNREDARREAEAVERRRQSRRACLLRKRVWERERERVGAAFASGRNV